MIGSRAFSFFFIALVAIVLAGLLLMGIFVGGLLRPASADTNAVSITIESGENLRTISAKLANAGLVENRRVFETFVWLQGAAGRLQAGEYELSRDLNVRELASILTSGKDAARERTITIIEGWTLNDIATYLETQGIVSTNDFLQAAQRQATHSGVSVLAQKPASADIEGYLFPDSYRIFKGASADEIVVKMLTTLDRRLTREHRQAIVASGRSIHEVLILASILEREIRNPEDLPVAAGVFMKRLEANDLLQSDATLNYVLPKGEQKPRLTLNDLQHPSPYNTYRYAGLPPGPIANPGFAAITAAIYPDENEYWYFLTDDEGTTHFARSYAEHLENRRRYLEP